MQDAEAAETAAGQRREEKDSELKPFKLADRWGKCGGSVDHRVCGQGRPGCPSAMEWGFVRMFGEVSGPASSKRGGGCRDMAIRVTEAYDLAERECIDGCVAAGDVTAPHHRLPRLFCQTNHCTHCCSPHLFCQNNCCTHRCSPHLFCQNNRCTPHLFRQNNRCTHRCSPHLFCQTRHCIHRCSPPLFC